MPDLKSEMAKVINAWDTPTMTQTEPRPHGAITNNVTRIVFDTIAANPGIDRRALVARLAAQGFLTNSTSSIVTQLLRKGNLRIKDESLFTAQPTYAPIKDPKPRPAKVAKVAVVAAPEAKPAAPQIDATWDAETLLNNLSIKQARALYDELRKIFGG
jgi:hypothetical protein